MSLIYTNASSAGQSEKSGSSGGMGKIVKFKIDEMAT